MIREMSVAGSFYPARDAELERYFEEFNKIYTEKHTFPNVDSKAVIVPHAGYIYSGYTANIAYKVLQNSSVNNFVVIGPSHRVAFDGVSMCDNKGYETPFGDIKSATEIVKDLKKKFHLPFFNNVHAEHSTEVQFPFIKHYLEDVNIVELVYSNVEAKYLSEIIDYLLEHEDCGVIISTDLSHFYTLENANKLDEICLQAIAKLDLNSLHSGCEACGILGVEAMIMSAKKLGLKSTILDYRTSADVSGDANKVVGYVSAYFD